MIKNTSKFFILLASILIGFLIVVNVGKNSINGFFNMNSIEYKDAIEERNKLYYDITALSEDNYELIKRIALLDVDDDGNSEKVVEHMKEQLDIYSLLSGVDATKGSGIILTINDGDYNIHTDSQDEVNRKTLHSADAALILNELRTAGAEAIAINNYRVLNTTGLVCAWAFIRFEENGNDIHQFVLSGVGNSADDAAFTHQVAEHQHTD